MVPKLKLQAESLKSARVRTICETLDEIPEVRDRILTAIADEPPANLADGGTIRAGFHAELDELRDISRNSRQYIAQIETRERGRTGIQSLKVRFNNVFGYYIEISKANLHLAPPDYERKQTLVNAERFTTPELKELESKILDAEEKILDAGTRDLPGAAIVRRRTRARESGRPPPLSRSWMSRARWRRWLPRIATRGQAFPIPARFASSPDAIR